MRAFPCCFVYYFLLSFHSSSFCLHTKKKIDSSPSNAHKQTHFAKTKRQRETRLLKKVPKQTTSLRRRLQPERILFARQNDEKEKRDYNCKKRSSSSSDRKNSRERNTLRGFETNHQRARGTFSHSFRVQISFDQVSFPELENLAVASVFFLLISRVQTATFFLLFASFLSSVRRRFLLERERQISSETSSVRRT